MKQKTLISKIVKISFITLAVMGISGFLFSCTSKPAEFHLRKGKDIQGLVHPEWSKNAVIYEVNIRQYSEEGSFNAVTANLERLKNLGVDILWLMPVHPISELNRKGELGSYYAVQDYKGINPEYGTAEDLQALVDSAHAMGMKVILDWVANHTGWDNPWITEHPEWYTHDSTGAVIPPVPDWSDVADLNYDVKEMRSAMIDAMAYWVKDFDVDGFRCDVAWGVPVDFWNEARTVLDTIKPVFMLAEAEDPALMKSAFDMCYGWEFHHIINSIATGDKKVSSFREYFAKVDTLFGHDDIFMNFITNHDENSWAGTEFERFGNGVAVNALLTYTVPGMPLIYSGQEVGFNKRLEFFEKDPIDWTDKGWTDFYTRLNQLKHEHSALWTG
ncbi:MAG: alpha-amylase family glycosyl hydrolase, partial [Bacteroidota bacterium]